MAIAIILSEPENCDNIGAVARALKNMDLSELRLVKPPRDWRTKAAKMAVNATSVLEAAKEYPDFPSAIADCHFVLATTRRQGIRRRAFIKFDEAIARVRENGARKVAAVVFGRESKGLNNEELGYCDWFTTIPTGDAYPSINLAQAVMIVCFSLFTRDVKAKGYEALTRVSKEEFEVVMKRFVSAVTHLEYNEDIVCRIDKTFRALAKRAGLLKSEGEMIKGLSRRILERTTPKYAKKASG